MTRTSSRGVCELCGKKSSKGGMTRHLDGCVPRHDPAKGKPETLFRIRVESQYVPLYWLDLEMKGNLRLAALDEFLRFVWLECCGHLSGFEIGDNFYSVSPNGIGWGRRELGMNVPLCKALKPGLRFRHEYDFGSTTHLRLHVRSERKGVCKNGLRLLARNDAPVWPCLVCGEPATDLCIDCYEEPNPFFCRKHGEEHGCEEDALRPVVNSPRMGVCGYG